MVGILKRFSQLFAPSPKAKLSLRVKKNELYLGEELSGSLSISSQEELDVDEIYVSLRCVETVTKVRRYQKSVKVERFIGDLEPTEQLVWKEKEYDVTKTLFSTDTKIMSFVHLTTGYKADFPFAFKLPISGRETYHSVDNNLRWSVTAFMKAKNRRPLLSHGGGEILVAKPTVSATPIKEVIREVVLIPCAYCGGLMPQTSIFCPNCGARRK
jgi:hypothetical protein